MKILSIKKVGLHEMLIWYEDDVNYNSASVYDNNRVEIFTSVPIAAYKSYEHFVADVEKFNIYTIFMIEPVAVDKLDFNELLKVWSDFKKKMYGG
jgi:hypothetical protein